MFLSLKTKQQQFSVELVISEEEEKAKWCENLSSKKFQKQHICAFRKKGCMLWCKTQNQLMTV